MPQKVRIALLRRQSRDVVSSSWRLPGWPKDQPIASGQPSFIKSKAAIFGTGRGITQQSAAKSDVHIPVVVGRGVGVCVWWNNIWGDQKKKDLFCILSHGSHHWDSKSGQEVCVCACTVVYLCYMAMTNEVFHSLQWNLQKGGFR